MRPVPSSGHPRSPHVHISARSTLVVATVLCLVVFGSRPGENTTASGHLSDRPHVLELRPAAADEPSASPAPLPPAGDAEDPAEEGYPAFASYPTEDGTGATEGPFPWWLHHPPGVVAAAPSGTMASDARLEPSEPSAAPSHAMDSEPVSPVARVTPSPGASPPDVPPSPHERPASPGPLEPGQDAVGPVITPAPPEPAAPAQDPVADVPAGPPAPAAPPAPGPAAPPAPVSPAPPAPAPTAPPVPAPSAPPAPAPPAPALELPTVQPGDLLALGEQLALVWSSVQGRADDVAEATALGLWWALIEACAVGGDEDVIVACGRAANEVLARLELAAPDPVRWLVVLPAPRDDGYRMGLLLMDRPSPQELPPMPAELPGWATSLRAERS
jgi:hypothetical protein